MAMLSRTTSIKAIQASALGTDLVGVKSACLKKGIRGSVAELDGKSGLLLETVIVAAKSWVTAKERELSVFYDDLSYIKEIKDASSPKRGTCCCLMQRAAPHT